MKPLLPNNKIIESVSMNGGDIIGSVAIKRNRCFVRVFTRTQTNAKTKPMTLEIDAVVVPNRREFQRLRRSQGFSKT